MHWWRARNDGDNLGTSGSAASDRGKEAQEPMRARLLGVICLFACAAFCAALVPAFAVADPTVAAAGDIACDTSSAYFNGGAGTETRCRQMATSNLFVNRGFS